jgi:hypothetical protein
MATTISCRLRFKVLGLVAFGVLCVDPIQAHAQVRSSASCAVARGVVAKACFVGEYSLTVNDETGASLLLSADNRFQWFYRDQAGRKYATGNWQVRGAGVLLTPEQPNPTAPVFELVSQEPWNETAELRLRMQLRGQALARAETQCPVFVGDALRGYSPPERAMPSKEATKNAEAALAQSLAAKSAYERAVSAAVAAAVSQRTSLIEAANEARADWVRTNFRLESTHQIAGLAVPSLGRPSLPSVCTIPAMYNAADVPETAWQRGISINIDNAGDRFLVSQVKATLTYSDGRTTALETNSSGLAFAPFDPMRRVMGIDLGVDTPIRRTRRFAITPIAQGVINFTVNGDLLNGPPFGQLSLARASRALVSNGYLPGRYERVENGD